MIHRALSARRIATTAVVAVATAASVHTCSKNPAAHTPPAAAGQSAPANPKKNLTAVAEPLSPGKAEQSGDIGFPVEGTSKAEYFKALAEYGAANGPAAVPRLRELLNDPDWQVRCAALRALAATGSAEAVSILKSYVSDQSGLEEAAQATLALGDVPDPSVSGFLMEKYRSITKEDLRNCLLETLASRPYGETASFFQGLLTSPSVDAEKKGEMLRALGFHRTVPNEILLTHIYDKDPAIRAASFDAIAFRQDQLLGQTLVARLASETDSSARQSLYNAMAAQRDLAPYQLERIANAEVQTGPKIRAYKAWAAAIARNSDAGAAAKFDSIAIPDLVHEALVNPDPGEQRAALQALAASRIPAAASALETISQTTRSPRLSSLASQLSQAIAPK